MKTIGERIRYIRNEREFTLDDLAKKAGISKSFLWAVENDKSDISGENLINITNALGASVEFILKGGRQELQNEPIEIPAELSEAAQILGLSFRQTLTLLQAHQSLIARRSTKDEVEMTRDKWKMLWEGIKDFVQEKS